jgi:hypothetical protein
VEKQADKSEKIGIKEKLAKLVKLHKESRPKPSNIKGDNEPS